MLENSSFLFSRPNWLPGDPEATSRNVKACRANFYNSADTVEIAVILICRSHWQTQVATFNVSGGSSPYIDSNNLVKARITIYASTGALSWHVDVDQMVFLYK